MDKEISHEDFETIINEEKKYRELNESIRMMNSQRSDAAKVKQVKMKYVLMKLLKVMKLLIKI